MFVCLECGKKFKTVKSAEKASYNGCPKCGGVDIDLDVPETPDDYVKRIKLKYPSEVNYIEGKGAGK